MREQNKSLYYVARPITDTDEWGAVFTKGYAPLLAYQDLINTGAVSSDIEKFGEQWNVRVQIVHDRNDGGDDDVRDIIVGDGVWLFDEPSNIAGENEDPLYDKPLFIVESVTYGHFGNKTVYTLKRTVE